jgi:uncharacterized membrane protein YkvI
VKGNYTILSRLLAIIGVVLLVIGKRMNSRPEKDILQYVGLALIIAVFIQFVLFSVKPGLFKDKSKHPDQD